MMKVMRTRGMRMGWLAAAAVMAMATLTAQAANYYVDVSWTGTQSGTTNAPYATIKAAVDAANAIAATHTIYIAAGTYADVANANGGTEDYSAGGGTGGGIKITRRINFYGGYAGWNGDGAAPADFDWTEGSRTPRATVIDLEDAASRAFWHEAPVGSGSLFDGLTFQNASHAVDGGTLYSPHAVGGRNMFVNNCMFTNNVVTSSAYGGAIWVASRENLSWFRHSDFVDNGADYGGAISVNNAYPDSVEIEDCTFLRNHARARGGAIHFLAFGGGTGIQHVRGCHFESNTAALLGGAIMSPDAGVRIERSVFTKNVAPSGAAMGGVTGTQSFGCSYYLENCLIYRNTGGYAIEQDGPRLTAYSVDILHCTIVENPGGGVKFRDRSDSRPARVRSSIIAFNGNYGIYRVDNDDAYNFSHNNVYGNTNNYYNCEGDGDSISSDPLFLDTDVGNYRLAPASPSIDAGADDTGLTADVTSVSRPTRNGWDQGCYEEWQIPIIANRAVLATGTSAVTRAEFVYESEAIDTYTWFVIDTADKGTGAINDWWQSAAAGEQSQGGIFGAMMTGLTANVTYTYRCVASNSYDMHFGPVGTFKTTSAGGVTRLWTGLGGDGLASNPANWDDAAIPGSADYVVLDASSSNMTWNTGSGGLPDTVATWTQTENYAGTVSLMGTLTVNDRMTVNGGVLQTAKDAVSGINVADRLTVGTDGTILVRRSSTTAQDAWGTKVGAGQTVTAGSAVIDGLLSADAQGFTEGQGPAFGDVNRGGSHGGEGAGLSLSTYGSVTNPTALGSGGRSGYGATPGGGAIVLSVTDHVTVNGVIGADASHIGGSDRRGAGGSIYITAASLSGTGTIRANGGNGYLGGGGGRVAVVLTSGSDFGDVAIRAFGGDASEDGAAGTIYLKHAGHGAGLGELVIDNNNLIPFSTYPFTQLSDGGDVLHDFSKVTIRKKGNLRIRSADTVDFGQVNIDGESINQATLAVAGTNGLAFPNPYTLDVDYTLCLDTAVEDRDGHWLVPDGGRLSHTPNGSSLSRYLDLTVSNLTVVSGGEINVSAKGYLNGYGPSPGTINIGACHGGQGAASSGANYGSILKPLSAGSGGRSGTHYGNLHGGGVINLAVGGALVNDGDIIARGSDKNDRDGAGGSIQIRTGTLSGGGSIDARGSNAFRSGGGGRVAIKLTGSTNFGSVAIQAYGGSTGTLDTRAAAGTVYTETTADEEDGGWVLVDNNGQDADTERTSLPASSGSTENLLLTRWIIQNFGEVKLINHVQVASLTLNANGYLDLNGYTVTVTTLSIDGAEVRWGDYQAGDPALGSRVTDAAGTGWVKILPPPQGTLILLR